MQFAIIVLENKQEFAARTDSAKGPEYMGAYAAYSAALAQAGVARGGAGLMPPETATTIKIRGGRRDVKDGPFIDSKEQIGGFFLIEAPDMEAALQWAERCPAAALSGVEVRPLLPPPPGR
ncbi:MAG: YciI family protein [Tepidisphaera sp.]|nr:YciI family protein [Tepidisphaera sp.]